MFMSDGRDSPREMDSVKVQDKGRHENKDLGISYRHARVCVYVCGEVASGYSKQTRVIYPF